MRKRMQSVCTLYDVPHITRDGAEHCRCLGEISALLVARSSEENSSEDISRASQTVSALIPMRHTPAGGFVRGMTLTHGGAIYRMLTPVKLSRLWSVKCIRTHIG